MPEMEPTTSVLFAMEGALLVIWFLATALAYNSALAPTPRYAVTGRERLLARLPNVIRPPFSVTAQRSHSTARHWRRFEHRWWGAASAVDKASDRVFAVPALVSWLLLLVAITFLVGSVALQLELVRVLWALPTVLLLLNFSVFASTVALQQRAWRRRVPFEWQFTLLAAVHANIIRQSRRNGAPAEVVEERVMEATRKLERVLRNRYVLPSAGESDALAAHAWAARLQPVLEARARRLMAQDGTPPASWFDDWVDSAVAALVTPGEGVRHDQVEHSTVTAGDPMPRIPLAGLWGLTAAVAAIGLLTSSAAVGVLFTADWKTVGSVTAVVVGAATCANFAVGWFRRTGARA